MEVVAVRVAGDLPVPYGEQSSIESSLTLSPTSRSLPTTKQTACGSNPDSGTEPGPGMQRNAEKIPPAVCTVYANERT